MPVSIDNIKQAINEKRKILEKREKEPMKEDVEISGEDNIFLLTGITNFLFFDLSEYICTDKVCTYEEYVKISDELIQLL